MAGSRWYFPVYEGLFEAKHVAAMGQAIWLYGWMLGRAHVAQNGGAFTYNHIEAAEELGRSVRTIKLWFSKLQETGYINTRARHPYNLDVEVTNWRPREEWLNARQSEGKHLALPSERSAKRSAKRSATLCIPSISIKLSSYEYPTGTREVQNLASLSGAFGGFLKTLKASKNRPALLRELYRLCFGDEDDLPAYGYFGKVAKRVGGWGRLAELMWKLTTKPPTGDVLAYIQAMHKGGQRASVQDQNAEVLKRYRERHDGES